MSIQFKKPIIMPDGWTLEQIECLRSHLWGKNRLYRARFDTPAGPRYGSGWSTKSINHRFAAKLILKGILRS